MATYIAQMHKDNGSDFALTFVDFPGCVAAASTLQELARAGVEALSLHIDGMVEDGDAVPAPTNLDAYTAGVDNDLGLPILLVEASTGPVRSVRVNITLPEDLLRHIDQVSSNRSRFLADAARAKLQAA